VCWGLPGLLVGVATGEWAVATDVSLAIRRSSSDCSLAVLLLIDRSSLRPDSSRATPVPGSELERETLADPRLSCSGVGRGIGPHVWRVGFASDGQAGRALDALAPPTAAEKPMGRVRDSLAPPSVADGQAGSARDALVVTWSCAAGPRLPGWCGDAVAQGWR
jgi:hypothetical protein